MYFLVSDKKLRIEDLAGAPPLKKTLFSYFSYFISYYLLTCGWLQ
jgi:hypothetical protein